MADDADDPMKNDEEVLQAMRNKVSIAISSLRGRVSVLFRIQMSRLPKEFGALEVVSCC
jgi:hypothetical protein